jgi:methyl-accepting chemotaxis protein
MEPAMSDPLEKITEEKDLLGKIRGFLSGFVGYVDRENRREADKLLRQTVADRYEALWGRLSEIQRKLISQGDLERVGALEAANVKLRGFVDRVRRASYGYAGLFDAVRIGSDELARLYAYDRQLLEGADRLAEAIEQVAASMGTEELPAAVERVVSLSQQVVEAFDRRNEAILAG